VREPLRKIIFHRGYQRVGVLGGYLGTNQVLHFLRAGDNKKSCLAKVDQFKADSVVRSKKPVKKMGLERRSKGGEELNESRLPNKGVFRRLDLQYGVLGLGHDYQV